MKQKVLLNIFTSVLPILAFILTGCQGSQTEIPPYARASTVTPDPNGLVAAISILPSAVNEESNTNCTSTIYYWKLHPEAWPDQVSFGDVTLKKDQAQKWFSMENPDITGILFQQLYATLMNIKNGADSATIAQTVEEANNWLKANPPGSLLSEFIQRRALSMARTLDNYNSGRTGPEPCANQPPTPVVTTAVPPTATSILILIETPLPTSTSTPLPTSPGQEPPPQPQPTNKVPVVRTPRSTPTSQAPSKPTNTSAPPTKEPSPTPKPPTQPPPTAIRATPTSAPPLPTQAPN